MADKLMTVGEIEDAVRPPMPSGKTYVSGLMVEPKPRTWEYDFLEFTGVGLADFDTKLDTMGAQGWELTECFQLHNVFFFVMKRESTDVPKEGK